MGDYCQSFQDYFNYVKEANLPMGEMVKLQGGAVNLFTQWSVLHFLVYVVIATLWSLIVIVHDAPIASVIISLIIGILVAYILSHLGFFIVSNNGLCHPIVNAILGLFYLAWGIQYISFGANGRAYFDGTHMYTGWAGTGVWSLLRMVLFIVYGVTLVYMGIAAIMACNNSSSRGADDLKVESSSEATQNSSAAVSSNNVDANPEGIHVHVHVHTDNASQAPPPMVSAIKLGQSNGQYNGSANGQ